MVDDCWVGLPNAGAAPVGCEPKTLFGELPNDGEPPNVGAEPNEGADPNPGLPPNGLCGDWKVAGAPNVDCPACGLLKGPPGEALPNIFPPVLPD